MDVLVEPLDPERKLHALEEFGVEGTLQAMAMTLSHDEFVEFMVEVGAYNAQLNHICETEELQDRVDSVIFELDGLKAE